MGLLEVAGGFVGVGRPGTQRDYLTVPANMEPTAALFPAVQAGQRIDRGASYGGALASVSDGSKIVVPEGYGLLLSEDGRLTAFVDEPGSYIWYQDDTGLQTYIFEGELHSSPVRHSWKYFYSDHRPGRHQIATFVRLKELPFNRFGTQSTIYWDDAYLNAQVGAIAHGTYSLEIVDPIRFAMQFVPASFMQSQSVFDFTDWDNAAASQMFYEVVGSLSAALSKYANESSRENRITRIQQDSIVFAASLSGVVEDNYSWKQSRGVAISKVSIIGIEYDEQTAQLLREVQRVDAVSRDQRGLRVSASRDARLQSSPEIGGNENRLMELGGENVADAQDPDSNHGNDLVLELENLARALEARLISRTEYDAARLKALGL